MIVRVTAEGTVVLDEPLNFKKFHLQCDGPRERIDGFRKALEGVGTLESPEVAWISTRALKEWPPHAEDEAYRTGLEAMLAFARTKNWMRDDLSAVRAHVVWSA
jgi:hypothetical protein